jgi:Domain of unknown function (DUF4062)
LWAFLPTITFVENDRDVERYTSVPLRFWPIPNQPSVFISCVSPEFRQTRSRIAAILTRLGYTPVIQEIFGTEPGDLRQVLRDKIDACEGLIQIVGQGYGAEPPTVDAEYGRVS